MFGGMNPSGDGPSMFQLSHWYANKAAESKLLWLLAAGPGPQRHPYTLALTLRKWSCVEKVVSEPSFKP